MVAVGKVTKRRRIETMSEQKKFNPAVEEEEMDAILADMGEVLGKHGITAADLLDSLPDVRAELNRLEYPAICGDDSE